METLMIEATKSSPKIEFNPIQHVLAIKGQSYPENAFKFYEPIFYWVDDYLQAVEDEVTIEVDFVLPYINTSSSKCIMMLLDKFEDAFQNGKKIKLNWYYDKENESELECAEEFQEDFSFPFHIVPRKGD
ncbi:MAG TPA: DUF1987 domain-containing protein [Bacillota bacterium]|nr:DUF1987 domain-containing protein [Bacillota bacterium]